MCDKPGGCDKPGCGVEGLPDDFVDAQLDLVSVQVPSMDAEHEECADALRLLAGERSAASLQALLLVHKQIHNIYIYIIYIYI